MFQKNVYHMIPCYMLNTLFCFLETYAYLCFIFLKYILPKYPHMHTYNKCKYGWERQLQKTGSSLGKERGNSIKTEFKGSLNSVFQGLFPNKNRYKVNMAFNTPCIWRAAIIFVTSLAVGLSSPVLVLCEIFHN